MPKFTVHDVYTSMQAAGSAQDYRQKERQEWTSWDWLCALRDGIIGRGPEPESTLLQKVKGTIFALTALKSRFPGLTEEDVAVETGRGLNDLRLNMHNLPHHTQSLSEEESTLITDALDALEETNDLENIIHFEQHRRIDRYKLEARRYIRGLIEARQAEEEKPADRKSQARLLDITSRIFVAWHLAWAAGDRENDGEDRKLDGFNPDAVQKISDKMMEDQAGEYYNAILSEVTQEEALQANDDSLNEFYDRVNDSCEALGLLQQDPGGKVLTNPDSRTLRLAVLREVQSALNATGNGYTWFFRRTRDRNSEAYENVRTEIQHQIDCLETGLPLGSADDIRMLELLNAYTTGREKPFYDYAKIRQDNMLKLYNVILQNPADGQLTDYPASLNEVQDRYNTARGYRDPNAAEYIRLDEEPYRYEKQDHPKAAVTRYEQILNDLRRQYENRLAPGALFGEQEQLALRESILKLAALESIMTRERAGGYEEVEEDRLQAEMEAVSRNNHLPVMGALNAAIRRPEFMKEVIDAFDQIDPEDQHIDYFLDPAGFHSPLLNDLRTITYPTAGERLEAAIRELEAFEYPEGMGLKFAQIEPYNRLCGNILGLKRLIARSPQGEDLHVSDDELGQAAVTASRELRFNQIEEKAIIDSSYARTFAQELLNRNAGYADLREKADRFANGYIEDQLEEAREEFRVLQGGRNIPEEEKAGGVETHPQEEVRNKLVHLAALYNLRYVREERFPGREFASGVLYTSQEIRDAENDVRSQDAFMDAIDGHLATTDSVKEIVNNMASTRYYMERIREEMNLQAYMDAMSANDEVEIRRLQDEFRTSFLRQIALRNLQQEAGSFSIPITDGELETEMAHVRLSDEYLAVDRFIRTDNNNIISLYNEFINPDTLPRTLETMKRTVNVPQAGAGTIGAAFQADRMALFNNFNAGTPEGRAQIAESMIRMLAYREMLLQNPDGHFGALDNDLFAQKQQEIGQRESLQGLLARIRSNAGTAERVAVRLIDHADLYNLKLDYERAQANQEVFVDPLLAQITPLADLRAQEVYDQGLAELSQVLETATPGLALSVQQNIRVRHAAAMMLTALTAPDGMEEPIPDLTRRERVSELMGGTTEESRLLLSALERASLDGGKTAELLTLLGAENGQPNAAIAGYGVQTPEKWAQDAADKLQAAGTLPADKQWSEEERRDLVETYARLHVMRELAKDPGGANEPIALSEVKAMAKNYLLEENNLEGLEALFQQPQTALTTRMVSQQLAALAELPPANSPEEASNRLMQRIVLENLKKRYFAEAIPTDAQLAAERAKVMNSFAFRVLVSPANGKIPAVEAQDLPSENFDIALEGAVYSAPARGSVVLGEVPENSFEGLRRLAREEMRHDAVLGLGEEAERYHFAELYAIALLNDGTWKEGELPGLAKVSEFADTIKELPDFKNAMAVLNQSPEQKQNFLNELMRGAPAAQLTEALNDLSEKQRKTLNDWDIRKADLFFDVRSAMVKRTYKRLIGLPPERAWAQNEEGLNDLVPTREQAEEMYTRFMATNRLYMRNPGRCFFSEDELAPVLAEVKSDETIRKNMETALKSPQDMRLTIFNLAPVQFWTEIDLMETGREMILMSGGHNKPTGINMILDVLSAIVEARLSGRDIDGRIVPTDELNEERNRVTFTDEYIALENALRTDINELERIKAVLKLPAEEFKEAFDNLTSEYKAKYPEAEIPDQDTIGYDYLQAKRTVAALQGKDFANDEASRTALAHNVREIFVMRDLILNSEYDVALKKNKIDENDPRRRDKVKQAVEASKHRLDMLLGTEEQLAARLKDPQTAQAFIDLTKDGEDLRRLYGKKVAARRNITDPMEERLLRLNLGVSVPSHAERRETVLAQTRVTYPGEDVDQREARLQMQIASLFNLALHAAGTDPRKMPTELELGRQAAEILKLDDFKHAVKYLANHTNELADFLEKAKTIDSEAFAKELDSYSAKQQLAEDPKAEPFPNIMFRLKMKLQKEANEGVQLSATGQNLRPTWVNNTDRELAKERFMHFSAVNRLMQANPYRIYFSDEELNDSLLQCMNDERLQADYAKTAAGGPEGIRKDLFSYSGLGYVTTTDGMEGFEQSILDPTVSLSDKKSLLFGTLQMLAFLIEIKKDGSVENNYYAGDMQTRIFSEFPETPEYKALFSSIVLDFKQLHRFNGRLLPLNGDACREEYERIIAECRAPLDLDKRTALDKEILLGLGKSNNERISRQEPGLMKTSLANMLTSALYRDLPKEEWPNAETFLAQRDAILELPEFEKAITWFEKHPEERGRLARENLNATQLLARLDEASKKQHVADKLPGPATSNILFTLQRTFMDKKQSDLLSKNVEDNDTFKPNGQENLRKDFLNFSAYDALLEAHPDRLFFSQAEMNAAHARFENDPAYMKQLEDITNIPWIARKNMTGFRNHHWGNYRAAERMLSMLIKTVKPVKGKFPLRDAENLMPSATTGLSQTAVVKLNGRKQFYPGAELANANNVLLEIPEMKAIERAVCHDPYQLPRLINEVYSLNGEAFRNKLHEVAAEYEKLYPAPKGQPKVTRENKLPAFVPAQQAAPAQPNANPNRINLNEKPNNPNRIIIEEPQNEIRMGGNGIGDNRINVRPQPAPVPAPRKKAPEAAVRPTFKVTVPTVVVPDPKYKAAPAMAQLQKNTAQLEKGLHLQQMNKIPADNPDFVKAAYTGILQNLALNTLAQKPAFANKEVDKETLNQEMNRLKNEQAFKDLPKAIAAGHAKLILDGIKKLEGKPEDLGGFLAGVSNNPVQAEAVLNKQYPKAVPQYVAAPALPKTEVVNDQMPPMGNIKINEAYDTPLGRYKHELKVLDSTMAEWKSARKDEVSQGFKKNLQTSLTRLYSLRQMIAGTEDPDEEVPDLDQKLQQNAEVLNKDPGFQNAIKGVEVNDRYVERVVNTITKTASFTKMNELLQQDGEKMFRHDIKLGNEALKQDKELKDPEKDILPKLHV